MDRGHPLTLGTAGHIDHGKTALVAALTGRETDRLPEERERGISIALGYAPLTLPSGRTLSLVDVPGHERFVRTMVAGATGIDLALLVVAADDGVMPQTREHLAVLRALAVDELVVAVTKTDLADPARAIAEIEALAAGRADRARLRADRGGDRGAARRARRRRRADAEPRRGGRAAAPARRPGLHRPRRRDRGHRDAVERPRRARGSRRARPLGPGGAGARRARSTTSRPRPRRRVSASR